MCKPFSAGLLQTFQYLVLKQSFSSLFFIVMQLTAFRLGARWQLRVQCSTFGLRCCQHDRFGLARDQWETASFFFWCLLIDFPSRMYCLLLLWISLERCFQCGLPKSNLVLFNLRVGELSPLTVGPSTSERRSPSSVTTVAVSAAMVIKVEGLLYGNVGLSGVTAWVAEKDPSLKPAS